MTLEVQYLMGKRAQYATARRRRERPQRLVVLVPERDLAKIDQWGIAEGKTCRSDAVRDLINKGLESYTVNAV